MVVVSHLFFSYWINFRGRRDSCESRLPLFRTVYFPTAPFLKLVWLQKHFIYSIKCPFLSERESVLLPPLHSSDWQKSVLV